MNEINLMAAERTTMLRIFTKDSEGLNSRSIK